MKRFSVIMIVILLLLTTILSVSAAGYMFPPMPSHTERNYLIIYSGTTEEDYFLLFHNADLFYVGGGYLVDVLNSYTLYQGKWIKVSEFVGDSVNISTDKIIYDSTGTVDTGNNVTFFGLPTKYNDFDSVFVSMTEQINVTTVINIVVFIIGIIVVFVFLYWGIRKVVTAIMTAFKKGKISL